MAHIKWLGVQGTLTNAITAGDTGIESEGLGDLPDIVAPDIAYIVIDPNGVGGRPELVIVTNHVAGATPDTSATVEQTVVKQERGRERKVASRQLHPTADDQVRAQKKAARRAARLDERAKVIAEG